MLSLDEVLENSGAATEAVAFGSVELSVAGLAVDLCLALAESGRLEPFAALLAGEARALVPGRPAAHHLLGHVDRFVAAPADVCAAELRQWSAVLGLRRRWASLGRDERLRRGRDVAGGRAGARVGRLHGERAGPTPVAVALGPEQFAIAGAAVDLAVVFGEVPAVQPSAAGLVGAHKARDVKALTDGYLLFVEVHSLLTAAANARHFACSSKHMSNRCSNSRTNSRIRPTGETPPPQWNITMVIDSLRIIMLLIKVSQTTKSRDLLYTAQCS